MNYSKSWNYCGMILFPKMGGGGVVLPPYLGGGVPLGLLNPDPVPE